MNTSLKTFKRIAILAPMILIALAVLSPITKAQTSGVDLSFNPSLSQITTNDGSGSNFILQPDGKILMFGSFQIVNGVVRNPLARLNQDGSLDDSFECTGCSIRVGSVLVQPDGKIIIAGNITSGASSDAAARIARLNPDGSADPTFTSPFGAILPQTFSAATVRAIQPDGKILVSVLTNAPGAGVGTSLMRLNANGTIDDSFATVTFASGTSGVEYVSKVILQPDGKIYVGGTAADGNNGFLRRYESNGARDTTFTSPILISAGSSNGYSLEDFDVEQNGGKIVIVGRFSQVNGVNRTNVARLQPNGEIDPAFAPPSVYGVGEFATRVKILPDGGILTTVRTVTAPPRRFVRFNADGTADAAFVSPGNLVSIAGWLVAPSGRILLQGTFAENGTNVLRFAWLNPNGTIETLLNSNFGIGGRVFALAVQSDGKIILSGDFVWVNNVPRRTLVRLNADGTLDANFNPTIANFSNITKIVPLANGQILIGGTFPESNGQTSVRIKRLNSDGTADPAFDVSIPVYPTTFVVQPDGKILIGGFASSIGLASPRVIRLNSDGTLDNFNPTFVGSASIAGIRSLLVEPDGKILVGGEFNAVNGSARSGIARLNADGSLDQTFNAGAFGAANAVERLADGKYLVAANGVFRLNNNGTADTSFQTATANGAVNALFVEPNGNIIAGGDFTALGGVPRSRIARLAPNGVLDVSFLPAGADSTVRVLAGQPGGKVIVAGFFSTLQNLTRLGIARLSAAPPAQFDFDGDRRSDISLFRLSNGTWYILPSQTGGFYGFPFGQSTDRIAPADYDGDGKTDVAVFRDFIPGAAGNFAYFYILNSSDGSFRPVQFGATGDLPMSGDWDGDGKGDLAVYRGAGPAGGQGSFYYRPSAQQGVDYITIPLGMVGDKPLVGDFDGDGRIDPAVFRPSNGTWIILRSSVNQISTTAFGLSNDIPVPADYDGDGSANIAMFRPSNGTWYTSTNPQNNFGAIQFGTNGDLPIPADYDGDGWVDVAVFRPSNGAWYLNRTTSGFTGVQFGASGDKPAPNAFVR